MKRFLLMSGKVLLAYLLAGAVLVMCMMWPHFENHPHLPFSGFPAFLVWSPVAPLLLLAELPERPAKVLLQLLVFGMVLALASWLLFRSRKR